MERLGDGAFGPEARRAVNRKGTVMVLSNLIRFLRERRAYWSIVQELSAYSDRELHDIGIDRADIHEIARLGAREAKA